MPGVSVVTGRGDLPSDEPAAALAAARFADDYRTEVLFDGDDTFVGWSGYAAYPVTAFETEEWHLVLEGRLYDLPASEREDELARVARWLARGADEALADWLRARDGDFVIVAVERASEEPFVLTDAFARLPIYRASVGEAEVVSRELEVVRSLGTAAADPFGIDRLAVAQTALFGYRLGDRTLFDGVTRLPPATRLHVGTGQSRIYRHHFGSREHEGRPVERNARLLADRFVGACERRAGDGPVVISLSGGLDSRAVAAGFAAAGVDARAASFDRVAGGTGADVRAARQVAELLDVPWEPYRVSGTAAAENWLLDTKQGMASIGTAFVGDFLDQLVDDYGRSITLVTGDGGDKALPDLSPPRALRGPDDLASHLIQEEGLLDPGDAAAAAGVDESRLRESISRRLRSYPEPSPTDRYVHFEVRERGINWLNQGEDRNRYFCWSVSPFYARPFFDDAMNCPPAQKAHTGLYRSFLRELVPGIDRIEYADFGAPPASRVYAAKRTVYEEVARYPRLKSALLGLVRNREPDDETVRRIRTLLTARSNLDVALDPDAVERLLDDGDVPAAGASDLLTIAHVADDYAARADRSAAASR